MTNLKIKLVTAIATGAVLASSVAPAFAADITITGNGRDSESTASVTQNNTTSVSQSNNATINNNTVVNSNTGGNKASDNLGGDVHVQSGDAKSNVSVANSANSNVANVANCGCDQGSTVSIDGNGRGSDNTVGLTQNNSTALGQSNNATVNNNTVVNSNTGNNKANDNLGQNGDVHVTSGNVDTTVGLTTAVNSNVAQIGGGSTGMGSGVSAKIVGNGRNSDNTIVLGMNNSASVSQSNNALVNNNTNVNSNTGDNKANDNLGGDVMIDSGNAKSNISVDTMANFNAASLENCGCDMTVNAKIASNLRDSDNTIGASFNNAQGIGQASLLTANNNTVDNANTGNNKANDNGGDVNSDPHVTSGDSPATVDVTTSGNSNVVGTGLTVPMPGNNQVHFSFDWTGFGSLWSWLM
ncbi:hypothetical protein BH09PAT1_BH09PAT1_0560 [soil metagenome]